MSQPQVLALRVSPIKDQSWCTRRRVSTLKTLVLQALQQPTQVERLLHEVVESVGLVPTDAYPIRDRDNLPAAMQRIILRATNLRQCWAYWADGHEHAWLFVAELPLSRSRERGAPVLQLDVYREDGEMHDTGRWVAFSEGTWQRCAD
jgi:hypothetical protein